MSKGTKPALCALGLETAAASSAALGKALRKEIGGVERHDADAIHDMRVASRRLRAALGEWAPYLSGGSARAAGEHGRLITKKLGRARELDVTAGLFEAMGAEATGPGEAALNHAIAYVNALRAEESAAVEEAAEAAGGDALHELGRHRPKKGRACVVERAERRLGKRYAALSQRYDAWRTSQQEEALHEVRIAFKKLRYACELYAPLYGRRMSGFIRTLKDAQEHLGAWNDCRIAIAYAAAARATAEGDAAEGFEAVLGTLARRRDGLLHQWAEDGARFFAAKRRATAGALFASPSAACCRAEPEVAFTPSSRLP